MKGRPARMLAIALGAAIAACSSDLVTSPDERRDLALPGASSLDVLTGASTSDSSTLVTDADTTTAEDSTVLESSAVEPVGPLLSCTADPDARSLSSKYIGPNGGTVKLAPFTLKIPAGSLSTVQQVTLRRPSSDLLAIEATVGDSPHHQFASPVEFVVRVAKHCPDVTPEMLAQLKGVWIDAPEGMRSLKSWRYKSSGKIKFLTDHFSSYGIAW